MGLVNPQFHNEVRSIWRNGVVTSSSLLFRKVYSYRNDLVPFWSDQTDEDPGEVTVMAPRDEHQEGGFQVDLVKNTGKQVQTKLVSPVPNQAIPLWNRVEQEKESLLGQRFREVE